MDFFDLLNKFRTDVFDEPEIAVRRVLQSGDEYEGELNFEAKSQILNLRISPLRERHGKNADEPIGLALYVQDLTATKEYEKLKSDMISLMSHELRTPLTSINGFAELLTADDSVPPAAREFVTIIANESQRQRIIERRRRAFHRLAMGPRAARQVDVQIHAQLLGHLVGEAVGGLGVVAVVHPDHRHVGLGARDHVQDHGLEGAEIGGDDGRLAQADGPVHQAFGVAAELAVDACEVDAHDEVSVGAATKCGAACTASPW